MNRHFCKRFAAMMLTPLVVTACASLSIYPVGPSTKLSDLRIAATEDDLLNPIDPVSQLKDSRKILLGLRNLLQSSVDRRDTVSLTANEVLYYGTLLAVLGVTLDSRAARNTGAAVGAAAEIFTGHYKLPDQEVLFRKALDQTTCADEAIELVNPDVLRTFSDVTLGNLPNPEPPPADKLNAKQTLEALRPRTIHFVKQLQSQLSAALSKVVLSPASKDDLKKLADNWNDGRKANGDAKGTSHDPALDDQLAAIYTMTNEQIAIAKSLPPLATQQPAEFRRLLDDKINLENSAAADLKSATSLLSSGKEMTNGHRAWLKELQIEPSKVEIDNWLSKHVARVNGLKDQRAIFNSFDIRTINGARKLNVDGIKTAAEVAQALEKQTAEQEVFVSALYNYGPSIDLCLKQTQQ